MSLNFPRSRLLAEAAAALPKPPSAEAKPTGPPYWRGTGLDPGWAFYSHLWECGKPWQTPCRIFILKITMMMGGINHESILKW